VAIGTLGREMWRNIYFPLNNGSDLLASKRLSLKRALKVWKRTVKLRGKVDS
jgi:hypothetical protein